MSFSGSRSPRDSTRTLFYNPNPQDELTTDAGTGFDQNGQHSWGRSGYDAADPSIDLRPGQIWAASANTFDQFRQVSQVGSPGTWLDQNYTAPTISGGLSTLEGARAYGSSRVLAVPAPPYSPESPTQTPSPPQPSHRYKCSSSDCGMSFKKSSDLKRHYSTVHRSGTDPQYICRCGHDGTRKDNYIRHVKTCKGPYSYNSMYFCKCDRSSVDESEHIAHIRHCPRPASAVVSERNFH
ncbi:uncharacterized protein F4822DRAFT_167159 [Hypoxylon trugodes]|uniref:uncharacterized protein n=1 Tax=Hypoxylon trugodes TaxID=326681 RepID=UPI0021976820|nr:uncharacterized protein F4822DRAFT_167159 [Hypoxylon trugodes]KAI1390926.1 hypothetical protein F4822DRAFT_167159 [Hypoxylon trugodes]